MAAVRASAFVFGVLCAMGFCDVVLAGDYYKWIDAQGTAHYSQTPPLGKNAKTINVDDKARTPPPPGMGYGPLPADVQARAQADQDALQKIDIKAANSNCAAARQNIANLESGKKLVAPDSTGQLRTLDATRRAQALDDARAQTARFCSKH